MNRTIAFILMLTGPAVASAHGLAAEVKRLGDRVEVVAFFDDDTPAAGATVTVKSADATIAEGKTDAEGRWAFAVPSPGEYKVVVDAGDGHRARRTLVVAGDNVVSADGRSRDDVVGGRWARAAAGLAVIAALTVVAKWALRKRK